MRLIQLTSEGRLELNYMWLPTWLGLNGATLKELETVVGVKVKGLEATEQNLDAINVVVLDAIVSRFPELTGLHDYLDGLKFIKYGGPEKLHEVRLSTS